MLLGAGVVGARAQEPSPQAKRVDAAAPVVHEMGSPPFHRVVPKMAMPATLDPNQFSDPRIRGAYAMAAQIKAVLYQLPCYCGCDKEAGHTNLLDCYTGTHASICETCMMEGVFAYQQTKAGQNAGQIRAEIERGQWKNINLNDLLVSRTY